MKEQIEGTFSWKFKIKPSLQNIQQRSLADEEITNIIFYEVSCELANNEINEAISHVHISEINGTLEAKSETEADHDNF